MTTCDVLCFYELFGKKWTYSLFCNLDRTPRTFNQLESMVKQEINPTLLSSRLKEMIRLGLILKKEHEGRLGYLLTSQGERVKKILYDLKSVGDELGWSMPGECEHTDCEGCPNFDKRKALYASLD